MARKQKYLATPEGKAKRELGAKWIERVKGATSLEKDWLDDAQMATKAYTNEEKAETSEKTLGKRYDFNILFSNVETIVPAVINSSPVPDIRRRFNDPDPAARVVSDILERAISVQIDDSRLQVELEAAAQDAFLAGRGIVRIKFHGDVVGGEPDKEELEDAAEAADGRGPVEGNDVPDYDDGDGAESADTLDGAPQMGHNGGPSLERLENERIGFEAVSWKDYRHGPSKRWQDRPWDAFRFVISKDDKDDSFDSELIRSQFDESETKAWTESGEDICGWEIWCKKTKKVYFVSDNGLMLKVVDDPLGLTNFFPVPTPMQPIEVTGRLKPVNPFSIYRKLADQLDTISKRIDVLTKAMKVKGWYSGTEETLKSVIDLEDDEFAPIPDGELWSKSAGGIAAAIAFWPIEKFIVALQQLYSAREQTKQAIYEITGISDIVRGASSASETATAQNIKSQWGSLRIQKMQRMMERYARDLFVMMTEIIASRFTFRTLQEMTSIPILTTPTDTPEQVQLKNGVIALLRGKLAMYYRIDVESDSTIRADLTRQKAEVSQFLQGASAYFAAVAPLVQQGALPADAAVEIFASTSRMFNLGKSVEDTLEKMVTDARTKADAARKTAETGQGGNQPPDPAQVEAQIKTQAAQQSETRLQAEFDARMQRELSKAKYEDAKAAKELIIAGLNEQLKQLELQIRQADLQLKQRQLGMTLPDGFQEIQQ
ncbi:hypothetical protein [Agrobacterium tumefaciens]|uniref:hypothetical protein n=1 Tax=Agrobacterium tumefaciens TaxID=358 RepID=UPI0021D18379|nr:hypothetical protein [Agrobacterium tumefaciens]UXT11286.1 hypothetical protein FY141_00715 [Agrobacterium tumefaciens]UXT31986.1 hypothetical protein FY138_00695 [Agrobacterium tumefaciens]UXT72041.1 hypothetical protein FY132_00715 [Agrobacterium tumefaciens]